MVLRRVTAIAVAMLVAGVGFATPSVAEPTFGELTCSAPSGSNAAVAIDLTLNGLADAETVSTPVTVSVNGSQTADVLIPAGSVGHYVVPDALPASAPMDSEVLVSVVAAGSVHECTLSWSPIVVTAPVAPASNAPGATVTATASIDTARSHGALRAQLEYLAGATWTLLDYSSIATDGSLSYSFKVTQSRELRVAVYEVDVEDGAPITVSAVGSLNVPYATPTVKSKPASVLQGASGAVVVLFGGFATTGTATLQRQTSSGWATVKATALQHGAATVTWAPGATYTYRVAVKATGGSTEYTSTFKVTYLPRLTLKGPATAKDNSSVTFTLTHHLAPPFYAKLQKWTGTTWVTVKTFVPGDQATKVTAKITSTSKWRVSVGAWVSKAVTIKVT